MASIATRRGGTHGRPAGTRPAHRSGHANHAEIQRSPASCPQQNPQLAQIIAQLQAQAAQSNSALSDQANQQISAQRAVLDRQANQDVTRSLASNGLLASGGLASRMRDQISKPYEERLAASSADINANLQQQRTGTQNNLLQQLTGLQNSQNSLGMDQQRLQMQNAQSQYGMQMDAYNASVRANETAYQRSMDAYNMQQQQQAQQRAQQSSNSSASNGYSSGNGGGGGSMTGSVNGWNGGQNDFLNSGRQPGQVYRDNVNMAQSTNGQVAGNWMSQGNQLLRAQQEQAAAAAQNRQNSGLAGNGMSSAGSATGVSMSGPLVGSSSMGGGAYGQAMGGMYGGSYGGNYGNPATDSYQTGGWGA